MTLVQRHPPPRPPPSNCALPVSELEAGLQPNDTTNHLYVFCISETRREVPRQISSTAIIASGALPVSHHDTTMLEQFSLPVYRAG